MENVAGEQGLALQRRFSMQIFSDCHKLSCFNDGGFKLGHFGILEALLPILAFFKL